MEEFYRVTIQFRKDVGLEDVPRLKDAPEGRFVVFVFFFVFSVVVVLNGGGAKDAGHRWLSFGKKVR